MNTTLLSKLSVALGPSGFEGQVRKLIAEELGKLGLEPATDPRGNPYVTFGEGRPLMVVAAHMDEVGFLVRHVEDAGFLRVTALGGVSASASQGHEVVVMGRKGEVKGVVGSTPPHLQAWRLYEGGGACYRCGYRVSSHLIVTFVSLTLLLPLDAAAQVWLHCTKSWTENAAWLAAVHSALLAAVTPLT